MAFTLDLLILSLNFMESFDVSPSRGGKVEVHFNNFGKMGDPLSCLITP
jgi:hypothetical protein